MVRRRTDIRTAETGSEGVAFGSIRRVNDSRNSIEALGLSL